MLIGISGKMCSGKDTLARFINRYYNAQRIAFADKLKDIACDLFDIGDPTAKDDATRRIFQDVGVSMRSVDVDVWVNYAMRKATRLEDAYGVNITIPDVRFPNEAKAIERRGGVIIRVRCDEELRLERIRALYGRVDRARLTHVSETALDGYPCKWVIDSSTPDTMASGLAATMIGLDIPRNGEVGDGESFGEAAPAVGLPAVRQSAGVRQLSFVRVGG